MLLKLSEILSVSEARCQLSRLIDEVRQGAEKIITRNAKTHQASMRIAGRDRQGDKEAGG